MNANTEKSLLPTEFFRFHSSDEMDQFKLERNLKMTDMERFKMFISLMRLGKKLKNAPKIHKPMP
jgi:hypothetical protein